MKESHEATSSNEAKVDFKNTIERLEVRAKESRRRVTRITFLLFFSVFFTLVLVVYNVLSKPVSFEIIERFAFQDSRDKPKSYDEVFNIRVSSLMDYLKKLEDFENRDNSKPVPEELRSTAEYIQNQIAHGIQNLESLTKVKELGRRQPDNTSAITSAIGSAVFSLGAVAFVIMLIQIAVTFMRYHTRLAELYDAQADALRASNGDAELAYKFVEHFSPNNIDLGKIPTTLYEKALDTVKEVASKRG